MTLIEVDLTEAVCRWRPGSGVLDELVVTPVEIELLTTQLEDAFKSKQIVRRRRAESRETYRVAGKEGAAFILVRAR